MTSYDTVTDALKDLKLRGYTVDFNIAFDKITCSKNETTLNPHEFNAWMHCSAFSKDMKPAGQTIPIVSPLDKYGGTSVIALKRLSIIQITSY